MTKLRSSNKEAKEAKEAKNPRKAFRSPPMPQKGLQEPSSLLRRPNKTPRVFEKPQTAPIDATWIVVRVMVSIGLSSR